MTSIKKILIANRGEIAVRVIRSCIDMGISSVAVYSEVDRFAPHVLLADESYNLGGAAASESYLNIDKIIAAAHESGADAIHPGYGFLSENADFARRCAEEGIKFIGPKPESIRSMGDKTQARALMHDAGVPYPPGTKEALKDLSKAKGLVEEIGFPVLIKAAAGGGGKGMRIVHKPEEVDSALKAAKSEAKNAFGDDRIYIEKYLEGPRHVEFQIIADEHGNVRHLFDRECSIQRRHQKVVEEAPCAVLSDELRAEMAEAAVNAAKACGYVGAGTVEFLLDRQRNFYFLEMNTRLQVEHPVTELITGLDLVELQIRVARGEKFTWPQSDISIRGHAIECRIYAEDPVNNFLPSTGKLKRHRYPAGPGVRVDAGVEEEQHITIDYDPMISKLCSYGKDREMAIERMRRALREYEIAGVETTIPFCSYVLSHEAFRSADYTTHFVQNYPFNQRDEDEKVVQSDTREDPEENPMIVGALMKYLSKNGASSKQNGMQNVSTQNNLSNWWIKRRL